MNAPKPPIRNELEEKLIMARAPVEIFIFWCPVCDSKFMHDLGTTHIRQSGMDGKCVSSLIRLQFYR